MMIPCRLSTTTTSFPWVSTEFGPSTIQRQPADQFLQLGRPADGIQDDRDLGVPSIIYGHNFMPTLLGVKSVQYKKLGDPLGAFNEVHKVVSKTEIGYLFVASDKYTLHLNGEVTSIPIALGSVTVAVHRGVTYVHSSRREALYKLQGTKLELVNPIGVVLRDVIGVFSCGPHLILYTVDTLVRSSIEDPMDFTPSLAYNSGAFSISGQQGSIVTVLSQTQNSATVFTTAEAITMSASGSSASPFKFDRIPGVPGIANANSIIGTSQIALKTPQGYIAPDGKSTQVAPDVWQFLTGSVVEDYIGTTGLHKINASDAYYSVDPDDVQECAVAAPVHDSELIVFRLLKPLRHELSIVAERWYCFSYGFGCSPVYNWCVVYDTQLKRWGKLRIRHIKVLDFQPSSELVPLGIVIVSPKGQLLTLVEDCGDWDGGHGKVDSVILYGRLEHVRGRDLTVYGVTYSTSYEPSTGNYLKVLNSLNGLTVHETILPKAVAHYTGHKEFRCRVTGKGVAFAICGSFNLTAVSVEVTAGGYR